MYRQSDSNPAPETAAANGLGRLPRQNTGEKAAKSSRKTLTFWGQQVSLEIARPHELPSRTSYEVGAANEIMGLIGNRTS
jgi:hypothetical protein